MEPKDLVLLMLIPIILVSIIAYTDKNHAITGAVTAEKKEESNIIGTYSVNPSFKAKIDYSLDDYTKIRELLGFVIECAQNGNDVESCIKNDKIKNSGFGWDLGCDKGAEKVLYDFAEFLQKCINSDEDNCLCRKKMDIKKEDIQDYLPPTNEYQFTLTENPSLRSIDIELPNFDGVSYSLNKNGLSGRVPKIYSLGYDKLDGELKFNLIFINEVLNNPADKSSETFGPTKQIIIYKNQLNDNTKSIDFVDQKENTLIYPNGNSVQNKNGNAINPNDLPDCQLKPKNIFRFCATKKDYKIMAYDKLDNQVKERSLTIKFASYIPQTPPPPLANIEVFDKPKAEKSVILKWEKSSKEDVVKYNIYYGKSELKLFEEGISLDEIRKKIGFNKKELDLTKNNPIETNQINLNDCEFDFARRGCVFSTADHGIVLENEKLYYDKTNNFYFYALNAEDNADYDFTVTAIDKNGNEINNLKQKLNVVKNTKSIDNLPPDSSTIVVLRSQQIYDADSKKVSFTFMDKPTRNIDGSQLNDFNDYGLYYMKYTLLTQEDKAKAINSLMETKISNNDEVGKPKLLSKVKFTQNGQPFSVDISQTNPQKNNVYFFFLIANDNNGNPQSNQFKIKELGAVPLQLEITS